MHGYELRNFPQDLDREDFCSLVVEKLGRLLPEFDEVIIVAEPTALGDIRQCLSKEQKKKVTLEVPKDIDQSNVHQIERTIFGK
jgi:protein required for attachment to host cells